MKRSSPEEDSASNQQQENSNTAHHLNSNNNNNGSKRVKRSHHNVPIFNNFVSLLKSIPMQESSSAAVVEDSTMELASPSSLKYKSSSLIIHQDTNLTHPIYNILSFLDFDELIHTVALVSKATHYAVHHSVEHLTLDSENTNFGDVEHLSEEEQQNHNMTNMIDIVNRFPSLKVLSLDGLDFFTDVCLSKLVE